MDLSAALCGKYQRSGTISGTIWYVCVDGKKEINYTLKKREQTGGIGA